MWWLTRRPGNRQPCPSAFLLLDSWSPDKLREDLENKYLPLNIFKKILFIPVFAKEDAPGKWRREATASKSKFDGTFLLEPLLTAAGGCACGCDMFSVPWEAGVAEGTRRSSKAAGR